MNHSRSRRFLSMLLSILMMLSSIGIPAYAEDPATPTDLQPVEEQTADQQQEEPGEEPEEEQPEEEQPEEEQPEETPDETDPAEKPFEQKTGVDGVHFVITADADVFEPGTRLDI